MTTKTWIILKRIFGVTNVRFWPKDAFVKTFKAQRYFLTLYF